MGSIYKTYHGLQFNWLLVLKGGSCSLSSHSFVFSISLLRQKANGKSNRENRNNLECMEFWRWARYLGTNVNWFIGFASAGRATDQRCFIVNTLKHTSAAIALQFLIGHFQLLQFTFQFLGSFWRKSVRFIIINYILMASKKKKQKNNNSKKKLEPKKKLNKWWWS